MRFIDRIRAIASAMGLVTLAACAPPRVADSSVAGIRPTLPPNTTRARDWDEYKRLVGLRLVAANPDGTYTGVVPEPLLAIPVLEIELNADGSVRRVAVQRHPSQARDTVQLAMAAVDRAAPFGSVAHLPRPWKFSEVFLFRDDRRFKPRVLNQ